MKEYLIAVVVSFKGNFNKDLLNVWKVLNKKFKIRYVSLRSTKPHLTLASGFIKNINKLDKILRKKKFFNFDLSSLGLGILPNKEPLIYIRWQQNDELIALYRRVNNITDSLFIGSSLNSNFSTWLPKTTIAFKDFKYEKLRKILKTISHVNKKRKVKIDKLEVMKIDKKGEKVLFTYKLK